MAYNKSKNLESAQKYLHQDRVPQAIAEYQNILKHEPKDQVTLMTIGDLYVRQGETFQALEYFERLAKIFLNDGFVTKAIAIYKKIAKLAPEETRPVERLAELYVQQGVLSEARLIYLQLADAHERAGRHPQAAALLRKLLDAEPDNLRVQTRLAELSMTIGQTADAVEGYRAAAEQLHQRGDHVQAIKYADLALKIRPSDLPTTTLKARAMAAADRRADAVALLQSLPEIESGGESTDLLLDLLIDAGEIAAASELAEKIFARDAKRFAPAHRVAAALLETDDPERALPLIALVRDAMTAAGEHELLSQSLTRATERLPARIEAREWLVELYGRASDSFRLPDALANLAEAHEAAGEHDNARRTYERLLDRDPENEQIQRKYETLQARGGTTAPPPEPPPVKEEAPPVSTPAEPELDPDTQQFISQALTDVDLFSSYGLTQKAIDLLEIVRQRAPEHTPALERLLDLSVGSGDEQRTAELAAQLEQIHAERGNTAFADRFAELRRRFERASGRGVSNAPKENRFQPAEFAVPMAELEPFAPGDEDTGSFIEASDRETADAGDEALRIEAENILMESLGVPRNGAATPAEAGVHEVDLSEEWATLVTELEAAVHAKSEPPADLGASENGTAALATRESANAAFEEILPLAEVASVPGIAIPVNGVPVDGIPVSSLAANGEAVLSADDFLESLSAEFDLTQPAAAPPAAAYLHAIPEAAPAEEHGSGPSDPGAVSSPSSGPLNELFAEFRADVGDASDDEDPETHYNLGIAYREMGLIEEAISEFQKVAQNVSRSAAHASGSPTNGKSPVFRCAMQCYTLLGLAFMEKGEPAIAASWYERALGTPGLDQDSVLALRYDLGVAEQSAGNTTAARKSFSQVYGMNIDYRDVAERLAALGKGS